MCHIYPLTANSTETESKTSFYFISFVSHLSLILWFIYCFTRVCTTLCRGRIFCNGTCGIIIIITPPCCVSDGVFIFTLISYINFTSIFYVFYFHFTLVFYFYVNQSRTFHTNLYLMCMTCRTWYTIIGMTCRYLIYNHWYDMSLLDIQSLVCHVATWYTIIGMTCRYLIHNHWYDMSLLDIQSLVWHFATWYTIIGMTCYLIYNHWYDMSLLYTIIVPVWNVATWYTAVTVSWLCMKYSKCRSNVMSSYKSVVF